ncbi:MFS transporter [Lactiplantibacillus fabifermentans]|uniref:Transport protein n=1 Tax=Lactiplantibacillus fabifermentans DSM 21115 TaxID=1413187 RepID=A0A0R2P257_9LACO|nr:MFS transporter [Lactiplantibacillus fabifermentans]KRO28890.1 transport protein [Lactiplantibacillus fabifermentans DSM 21115]
MSATTTTQVTPATKRAIFGAAGLAFCGILVETSMNVTFPTLMRQFSTSLNAVQWVTTAYLLAVAATMVVAAFTQNRFKWRTIINIGGSAFVIGGLLCAISPSLWVLLLGRIIQAIGTGFALPLVFAQIMRQVPFTAQGRFTGTAGMLIALAPSLGPTYGGLVTQLLTWRLIFWITLPFGLLAWFITAKNIHQPQQPTVQRFPLMQFILIVLTLIMMTWAFNSIGTTGFSLVNFWVPLMVALLALWGFFKLAATGDQPLINVAIFHNRAFSKALAIYFLIQFIQIGLTFLLPNFTQLALGKDAMVSGLMLLAGSLTSAILSPLTGKWMDRAGIQKPARLGGILLILATLGFALVATHLSIPIIVGLFVVYQMGFSCLFNNTLTYGLQQLPPHQLGDGNATFNTLQQYSGSLGTAIMAALLATGSELHPHSSRFIQTTAGTQLALWLSLVIIVVTALIAWSLKPTKSAN